MFHEPSPDLRRGCGLAHLLATKGVLAGLEPVSQDNRLVFLPFRLCPLIFSVSAALMALGAWL